MGILLILALIGIALLLWGAVGALHVLIWIGIIALIIALIGYFFGAGASAGSRRWW